MKRPATLGRILAPFAFIALALLASRALVDETPGLGPWHTPARATAPAPAGPGRAARATVHAGRPVVDDPAATAAHRPAATPARAQAARAGHQAGAATGGEAHAADGEAADGEVRDPQATPSPAPELLGIQPAAEGAGAALPLAQAPPADLVFLTEAARLAGGARVPFAEALVARAATGAGEAELRAAVERDLAADLPVRLLARRWLAGREGRPVALGAPRPARALVGGLVR